jgi:hypothetical protein
MAMYERVFILKKRFSVEQAEYMKVKEERFKKKCYQMVYDFGDKVVIDNETVYILHGDEKLEIVKPEKGKSFWFETWTSFRRYYNLDNDDFGPY